MEAAAMSSWQPPAPGGLPPGKPASPPQQRGHDGASPSEGAAGAAAAAAAAAAAQHSLFQGFPDAAGGLPAQQLRNLQRLYGSLAQAHHHSSRTSLPDIQEEESSPVQQPTQQQQQQQQVPSGSTLATGLALGGSRPASKVMSEEDIFAMGGGLEIPGGGAEPSAGGSVQQMHAPGEGGAQEGGMVAGAPPLAYDLSLVGQMPAGQSQSRTLFVRNIDASVSDEELQAVFEAFGEIASIYTACKHRGFVVISYFDIRAATLANHTLQGQQLKGQPLEVHFSLPKDEKESRQGTVLVVSIDPSLGHQELVYLFSQFGDVKGIEQDPARPNCRYVEFYDVRNASSAVQGVNQAPDMSSRMVVMEAAAAMPTTPTSGAVGGGSQAALLGSSLPSDFMAGLQQPGAMKSVGSSPALLQQLHYGSQGSFGGGPATSSALDIAQYLLGNTAGVGGSVSMQNLPQHSQQQAAGPQSGAAAAAAAAAAMMAPGNMGDNLAGMARSLSELSLQSDLNRVAMAGGAPGVAGPGGGRIAAGTMSTGDLLALQQAQQVQQQGMGRGSGPMGLRGIASTGSIWSSATQQMYNNPASLGSSPVNSAPWLNALGTLSGSNSALQEVLAQQQAQQAAAAAALQQQAATAALLQNAAAVQAAAVGQGPLAAQNAAAMQAALQQALLNQQAAVLLQSGALGPLGQGGGAAGFLQQQRLPQRIEPPLGGRLARRPLDPHAEAERRAQQDKLYSLDIGRISSGEDKRTTLMIKNIPNKYTQKMLLGLVEERGFRGMLDFFYLPIDFKNKCNVGYAFINMVKPEYIIPLVEEFHGKRWPKFNSEKICNIAYGRIQGKAALVQHFQNSSLLHEDKRCRPVLFHTDGVLAGEQEPFPTSAVPSL